MIKNIIYEIRLHWAYVKHEVKWKIKGDTRCEFQKLVEKCRILKLSRPIWNPGKCSHNH